MAKKTKNAFLLKVRGAITWFRDAIVWLICVYLFVLVALIVLAVLVMIRTPWSLFF